MSLSVQENIISTIKDKLVDIYKPDMIYLFGSYVWGSPGNDSDIDICVIVKESSENIYNRIRHGQDVLWEFRIPVDLLVYTEDEIKEQREHPSTLISKIFSQGIKIYEAA